MADRKSKWATGETQPETDEDIMRNLLAVAPDRANKSVLDFIEELDGLGFSPKLSPVAVAIFAIQAVKHGEELLTLFMNKMPEEGKYYGIVREKFRADVLSIITDKAPKG